MGRHYMGPKFSYSVRANPKYEKLIDEIKKHLQGAGRFKPTISEAFEWALDLAAKELNFPLEKEELEFLDLANNPGQAIFLNEWKKKNLPGEDKKLI